MFKLKIVVVGPLQSGKTAISNFLAEATESSHGQYSPTVGVRILEFESESIAVKGRQRRASIELWDCSGDEKYESCWPAIAKDAHGVMLVHNPNQKNIEKELETWYNSFVLSQGMDDEQCAVFQYRSSGHTKTMHPHAFARFYWATSGMDDNGGESLKQDFYRYLERLLNVVSEKHDQEELNIISRD
ncbi:intraflagellar transport protein 22 homolog [Ornithodoros turicata]|uniref:intraflagellar transport protein 22 homolog n=1 Tax=Ornithodoros turicata TaxID=34597 RepID=UPI0031395651